MTSTFKPFHAIPALLVLGTLASSAGGAFAASRDSEAQARYRSERAACMNGTSGQDRATCMREAAAALAEARRNQLVTGDLARNALARCDALPVAQRQDCAGRVQDGAVSGSVSGGGILREYSRPATP